MLWSLYIFFWELMWDYYFFSHNFFVKIIKTIIWLFYHCLNYLLWTVLYWYLLLQKTCCFCSTVQLLFRQRDYWNWNMYLLKGITPPPPKVTRWRSKNCLDVLFLRRYYQNFDDIRNIVFCFRHGFVIFKIWTLFECNCKLE